MEQLFNDLQKHIALKLGNEIILIDEDYGQLEALMNGEDQYPVTFPCVLISMPEVKWSSLGGDAQRGTCLMTVRLAFDCYDDTRYGSGQEGKAAERMSLSRQLNRNIHLWRFEGCSRVMERKSTRGYSLAGGVKVYEHVYETEMIES